MTNHSLVEFPGDCQVVFLSRAGPNDELPDWLAGNPLDCLGESHVLELGVVE